MFFPRCVQIERDVFFNFLLVFNLILSNLPFKLRHSCSSFSCHFRLFWKLFQGAHPLGHFWCWYACVKKTGSKMVYHFFESHTTFSEHFQRYYIFFRGFMLTFYNVSLQRLLSDTRNFFRLWYWMDIFRKCVFILWFTFFKDTRCVYRGLWCISYRWWFILRFDILIFTFTVTVCKTSSWSFTRDHIKFSVWNTSLLSTICESSWHVYVSISLFTISIMFFLTSF